MFRSRRLNNKINRLHEGCLTIIYNDRLSNFEEPLNKVHNYVSKYHINVYALVIELLPPEHFGRDCPASIQQGKY